MRNAAERFAVFVNFAAQETRAARKWQRVQPALSRQLGSEPWVETYSPPHDLRPRLREFALDPTGPRAVLAAGGDGTVHHLLNAIMELGEEEAKRFSLGSVGLGSSNDFLKPYGARIEGIPSRIDSATSSLADLGRIEILDPPTPGPVHFAINASIGITAQANYLFNHPGPALRLLKRVSTPLAIVYAALATILSFRNPRVELRIDGRSETIDVTNAAILKNPHVSGSFRFDLPIRPDDGRLGFCLCEGMTRLEAVSVLKDLAGGKFSGKPKRRSQFATEIEILSETPIPLEADGEVQLVRHARIRLIPKAIRLLGTGGNC